MRSPYPQVLASPGALAVGVSVPRRYVRKQTDLRHQPCHRPYRRRSRNSGGFPPDARADCFRGHTFAAGTSPTWRGMWMWSAPRHLPRRGGADAIARRSVYPGGPHIDNMRSGDPKAIKVPQGLTQGRAGREHPYGLASRRQNRHPLD